VVYKDMLVRIRVYFKIVKRVGTEVTLPQDFSITIVIQRIIFIMIQSKVKEKENDNARMYEGNI